MTDSEYKKAFGEERIRHKITVYNREDFESWANENPTVLTAADGPRIIEIYSSPKGKPVFDQNVIDLYPSRIIALDFEDFPEDVHFPGSQYHCTHPTITYADAERLVRFIHDGIKSEQDFVVHCDAGVSRSQQVAEYIRLMGYENYLYDTEKSTHTHHVPSTIVLARLLEVKHKTIPSFHDRNNEFVYDNVKQSWILR